jgi:hypothetical protein
MTWLIVALPVLVIVLLLVLALGLGRVATSADRTELEQLEKLGQPPPQAAKPRGGHWKASHRSPSPSAGAGPPTADGGRGSTSCRGGGRRMR